jgi:predicted TPR repeat methyltransferase
MNDNIKTIAAYNKNIVKYNEAMYLQVDGLLKEWIDSALRLLSQGARILELGSGEGRDAAYIEAQGYDIERTDASTGFVEYLHSQGCLARELDALSSSYGGMYGLIFANAVFIHFDEPELKLILGTVKKHLNPNGILAFSVKAGEGEEWSTEKLGDERYFKYWNKESIVEFTEALGLKVLSVQEAVIGDKDVTWHRLIARKNDAI